jgi:6-phosphogluconolactonase (cycloisomerase 2 family)
VSAQLVEIAVGPPNAHLAPGTRMQFTATGLYAGGSRRDLTSQVSWSSADPAVAATSMDATLPGIVTGTKPGETTIIATSSGGLSRSVVVTVDRATLVSISVTPPSRAIAKGTQQQFIATGLYSDNSTQNLSLSARWSVEDPAIASVDSLSVWAGRVSALGTGTTRVTATFEGVSGSATLTVTPASLTSIQITPATREIALGLNATYAATGIYTDGSAQDVTALVTWGSTAPSVASISNAVATSAGVGTTRITASLAGITGTAPLKVTGAQLTSIAISPTNTAIARGLSTQLTAIGTYTDHSTQDLTGAVVWSSSDSTIASISNAAGYQGLSKAEQPGSATISGTLGAVSGDTTLTVTTATLVSISVTPAALAIAKGTQQQFTATGTYTDNSTQDLTTAVTWNTTGSAATISNAGGSQGLATGADVGQSILSATLGSVAGSSTLTVTAATLVSIGVTPATPSISNGTQQLFTATGTYTDHSTQDLTTSVTWSSSNTAIASVDNSAGSKGLASAVAAGSTTISAALGTVNGSTTLTVTAATLVSITVVPAAPSIANGTQKQFAATGVYSNAATQDLTSAVTWASSNTSIATISNASGTMGLASSVSAGSTSISAVLDGVTGSTLLTVTPATLVSIAVIPASPSIAKGTQLQFTATGTYTDNSTQNLTASITWASSVPSVASISITGASKGLATAASVGATTVSATLGSISGSTVFTVTPATLVSIAVTPTSATIPSGTQKQFSATGTYTDGSTQNLTATVTWGSSNLATATISNAAGSNGLATGTNAGTTSIRATSGSVTSPAAALTVNSGQAYVYVVNQNGDSVSQYKVEAGGGLTFIGTVPAGSLPTAIAVDPLRRYAYVIAQNSISEYTVGTAGTLTLTGTPAAGATPISGAVDPSGKYFYAANFADDTISQFSIGTGGALSALGAAIGTGMAPNSVAVDPLGRSVYTANLVAGTVSQFRIGTTGALTSLGAVIAEDAPASIAVDPAGRYAYVANFQAGTVSQYSVGTGGALTWLGSIGAGGGANSVAVDPTGRFVYTANQYDDTVSAFSIGSGGTLTLIGTVPSGAGPYSVSVDPSGRYVYVANSSANSVSQYTINVGGSLSDNGTVPSGPYPVAVFSSY